jgi:adenosylhomocysteinase
MDGFTVMPMDKAAAIGEIFITTTGNTHIIVERHFNVMKDGAILANAGHFNVEIDVDWLEHHNGGVVRRDGIDSYRVGGKTLHVLAEGRLVNLATPKGMGHPVEVMDLSFALQALCAKHVVTHGKAMGAGVFDVPQEIDEQVARMKLDALGFQIDSLTPDQRTYMSSWDIGT